MTTPQPQEVTQLLRAWQDGDEAALGQLAPLIEGELRRRAEHYLRQERSGHTLQPTALVNEVYLRLLEWQKVDWKNRAQFMGVAAIMMRRILVDYARRQQYVKRGNGAIKISLDEEQIISPDREPDLVELDDALTRLAAMDPRKSRVIELRFFGGLSVEETAEVLKIATRTVKREWSLARAWLYSELANGKEA